MKPCLVFVGATGAARAPIAAGLAQAFTGENAAVGCTAISPGKVHSLALQVMTERGIVPPDIWPGTATPLSENCNYIFLLCDEAAEHLLLTPLFTSAGPERMNWYCSDPLQEIDGEAACLSSLRAFCDEMERKLTAWLAEKNLLATDNAALLRVWRELARYEHPLFAWKAVSVGENVEIRIRFKPPAAPLDGYAFQLRPRELENRQFPWLFQKQFYDCLHDYVIELFSRNPQQDKS